MGVTRDKKTSLAGTSGTSSGRSAVVGCPGGLPSRRSTGGWKQAFPSDTSPRAYACHPTGCWMVVTNETGNSLTVVGASLLKVLATMRVGKRPRDVASLPTAKLSIFPMNSLHRYIVLRCPEQRIPPSVCMSAQDAEARSGVGLEEQTFQRRHFELDRDQDGTCRELTARSCRRSLRRRSCVSD